jgi:hypothetical protein
MEFSSSGDEDEVETMDVEVSGEQQDIALATPYREQSKLLSLIRPRTQPGPARLLSIPEFEQRREALGGGRRVRIVCLSDTHMKHTFLTPFMPQGGECTPSPTCDFILTPPPCYYFLDDHILLHAGDFTSRGQLEHALQFNDWLGSLHYRHKFIVSGAFVFL